MFFNLTCLVLPEDKGVQLYACEKVSTDFWELLKGPQRLPGCALSLPPVSFPPELMTLIYLNRRASQHRQH